MEPPLCAPTVLVGVPGPRAPRAQAFVEPAKETNMCQTCGCSPCKKCGKPIENKVCSGCKKPADKCTCKPAKK